LAVGPKLPQRQQRRKEEQKTEQRCLGQLGCHKILRQQDAINLMFKDEMLE
jgi:hypothetical protein